MRSTAGGVTLPSEGHCVTLNLLFPHSVPILPPKCLDGRMLCSKIGVNVWK